jgi:hypothetical protein
MALISSARPSIEMAGVTVELTNLVMLGWFLQPTSGARYSTLKSQAGNGSAGSAYAVPANKTLYMRAARWTVDATGATAMTFGYGDTDVGNTSAGAPTNNIEATGNGGLLHMGFATRGEEVPLRILVPTGKYPYVLTGVSGGPTAQFGQVMCELK